MCKKWRKECYSEIGAIFFTVPVLVRTKGIAQNVWNTAVYRKHVVALDFSHQEHADPCFNSYCFVCGNWAPRRFRSMLEVLLDTFQHVVTGMAMCAQAPAYTQHPSQRATRANTSGISAFDSKEKEPGDQPKAHRSLWEAALSWTWQLCHRRCPAPRSPG